MLDDFTPWLPLVAVFTFLAGSGLILWRLEALGRRGFQGTLLGTLVTPYCSGLGNLVFVAVMLRAGGAGEEVLVNSLVNNATNLTLLLGLPAIFWALAVIPAGRARPRSRKVRQVLEQSRLGLCLSLVAAGFFVGVLWWLGRDGTLGRTDGGTLVALFLFWQTYSVYEVLRAHVSGAGLLSPWLVVDVAILLLAAVGQYWSIEHLVGWVMAQDSGWIRPDHLGWLSGWLMVAPNALLALYYARQNKPDIVYSSQVGDGHICIPLCVGLFALVEPIPVPAFLDTAALILGAAIALHLALLAILGRLPRWAGVALVGAYGAFCYWGLV
ncbi:MAG: sodium:calcium symporter [Opitutales bacterium]